MLVALAAAGCTTTGSYSEATRFDIVAPPDRAEVELPVRVAWEPDGRAHRYAVVVDRPAMPPGETVDWFGSDAAGVVETDATEIVLGRSLSASSSRSARHSVVVVALDRDGRRIDETAAHVSFRTGGVRTDGNGR